jgi:hypothetical protein
MQHSASARHRLRPSECITVTKNWIQEESVEELAPGHVGSGGNVVTCIAEVLGSNLGPTISAPIHANSSVDTL